MPSAGRQQRRVAIGLCDVCPSWAERSLAAVWKFSYAGLAYTLEDIPLVVSVDWSPRFFFGNTYGYYSRLGWGYGAVTMRYVLK